MAGSSKCPVCQNPSANDSKPFCSKKCKDVDLLNWFRGGYSIPAVELDDIEDDSNSGDDDGKV